MFIWLGHAATITQKHSYKHKYTNHLSSSKSSIVAKHEKGSSTWQQCLQHLSRRLQIGIMYTSIIQKYEKLSQYRNGITDIYIANSITMKCFSQCMELKELFWLVTSIVHFNFNNCRNQIVYEGNILKIYLSQTQSTTEANAAPLADISHETWSC